MLKRCVLLTACVVMLASRLCLPAGALSYEGVPSAKSVILMDMNTGEVLYEHNADNRMLIASTTKILTALCVLKTCSLDQVVSADPVCVQTEGSSMHIEPGEQLTVRQLLYGLLLLSGNDAAAVLAVHAAGSMEAFSALMNETAEAIGCRNSSFCNPHGLDMTEHYSSARDLALITIEAMRNPVFSQIVSTVQATVDGRSMGNHNRLLRQVPGVIGVKTGYTMAAGRTLVSCAVRGGVRLVCVTLDDPDDWKDHSSLYEWGFSEYRYVPVPDFEQIMLPVVGSGTANACVVPEKTAILPVKGDASVQIKIELPRFLYGPIHTGQRVGCITVISEDQIIWQTSLIAFS